MGARIPVGLAWCLVHMAAGSSRGLPTTSGVPGWIRASLFTLGWSTAPRVVSPSEGRTRRLTLQVVSGMPVRDGLCSLCWAGRPVGRASLGLSLRRRWWSLDGERLFLECLLLDRLRECGRPLPLPLLSCWRCLDEASCTGPACWPFEGFAPSGGCVASSWSREWRLMAAL